VETDLRAGIHEFQSEAAGALIISLLIAGGL
jgi:hypothetical protein